MEFDSNQWDDKEEQGFRRIGLEHMTNTLERQNEEIEIQRESISNYIKYYIFIIGFVVTIGQVRGFGDLELAVGIIILMAGFFYSIWLHREMGKYTIGFEAEAFDIQMKESETYSEALEGMTKYYEGVVDRNREHLDNYKSHMVYHTIIFGASFGAITSLMIFL